MDRFAIKISIWNSIIFCIAVGGPTILDPQIEHRLGYGARMYPLGLWVLIPSVLVFGLTYVIVNSKMSSLRKSILTFLVLAIPAWLTIPNFTPELPHPMVMLVPIWFGLWTASSVYIKYHILRYEFITRTDLTRYLKVERLKMEHETWFRILLGFLAGYIVVDVAIYLNLFNLATGLTSAPNEVILYQIMFGLLVISNAVVFLLSFVWEMVNKMRDIREYITSIP